MTKCYRVIRDTSTRRDHGTSTSDRVFRAGTSCVPRDDSTCWVRCTSASGQVHRASACCVIRGAPPGTLRQPQWSSISRQHGPGHSWHQLQRLLCRSWRQHLPCMLCQHPWSTASRQCLLCHTWCPAGYAAPAPVVEYIAPAPAVSIASVSGRVHHASACRVYVTGCVRCACCDRDTCASGRLHRAVSTAPVAEPTVMSFTVPLTGSTIVATAAVVTMRSASADCTDSTTPICSRGICVAMSCGGGSYTPDGVADHGKVHHQLLPVPRGRRCVCMLNEWISSNDVICADNYNYFRFSS